MAIGAEISPLRTSSLIASAHLARARHSRASRCAPAVPERRSGPRASFSQRVRISFSGNSSSASSSVRSMSLRIARQRHPAERPRPGAEERANILRHKTGNQKRIRAPRIERKAANVVAVVERHRARPLQRQHGIHVNHHRSRRAAHIFFRIALAQLRRLRSASAPAEHSRSADRARWSGPSPHPPARRGAQSPAARRRSCPPSPRTARGLRAVASSHSASASSRSSVTVSQ